VVNRDYGEAADILMVQEDTRFSVRKQEYEIHGGVAWPRECKRAEVI
jgi:hypothetical protein